jgi:hypothetical protein
MPWSVTVHSEIPVIETVYSGTLTESELYQAVGETFTLAHKHERRLFLADCSLLDGGHSVTDLFFLADFVLAHESCHTLKEAVLLNGRSVTIDHIDFWETTCFNRGLNVRIFHDRQSAIEWLLE